MNNAQSYLDAGRKLEIDAEKLRKREDLVPAGRKIGEAAIFFLKAICEKESVPCGDPRSCASVQVAGRSRSV